MNETIIKEIAIELNVQDKQVLETLNMLQNGDTIPFIARYRKEKTGGLTEEQIKMFEEDVKNNVQIDLKKYIDNKEDKYDNNISKTTLKLSNTIGETVEGILNFVFGKLENAMNG